MKGRREKIGKMSLQHCIFSCFLVVLFAISANEGKTVLHVPFISIFDHISSIFGCESLHGKSNKTTKDRHLTPPY